LLGCCVKARKETIEVIDEIRDILAFLELDEDFEIIDRQITLVIKNTYPDGRTQTADIWIPPELEKHVKKILKKKIRWIKKRSSGLLAWLLC